MEDQCETHACYDLMAAMMLQHDRLCLSLVFHLGLSQNDSQHHTRPIGNKLTRNVQHLWWLSRSMCVRPTVFPYRVACVQQQIADGDAHHCAHTSGHQVSVMPGKSRGCHV